MAWPNPAQAEIRLCRGERSARLGVRSWSTDARGTGMTNRRRVSAARTLAAFVAAAAFASVCVATAWTATAAAAPPGPGQTYGLTSGSGFSAVSPVRVLDTRNGTGGTLGPVGPGGVAMIDLSG